MKEGILKTVTEYYLSSTDFNGYPLPKEPPSESLVEVVCQLVEEGKLDVVFSDVQTNPHIKAFPPEDRGVQIQKIKSGKWDIACAYPSPEHLQEVINPKIYQGRPYLLELALGAPQLIFKAFDLSVLEIYRNDPRYYYWHNDINGNIWIRDQFYDDSGTPGKDKILLQTFGFCYDNSLNRYVAVYLRYLADLSPEHQQIWKAKEIQGEFYLHPDYVRMSILAEWTERISIFDAFLEELRVINRMCELMGRPHLFRSYFAGEQRPRDFGFLIRPTLKEFNNFVHLLDKMLSDNISKDFFMNEVPLETEEKRSDGKIVVRQKNTITLLNEWIRTFFRPAEGNWEPVEQMITVFRKIRKMRQKPAHAIQEDTFDMQYFHRQRELIIEVYESIRTLRLLLSNHPLVKGKEKELKIHPHVLEGKIWTY